MKDVVGDLQNNMDSVNNMHGLDECSDEDE